MLDVKVKKLVENAVIPKYAHPGEDAGLDLVATSKTFDKDNDVWIYGTGLALEIPKGYVGLIFPRSSVRKYSMSLTNCVGVIDSGYRGEVMFTFRKQFHGSDKSYEVGDKVGQLIIMPYPEVRLAQSFELDESERGTGGHGSTGK